MRVKLSAQILKMLVLVFFLFSQLLLDLYSDTNASKKILAKLQTEDGQRAPVAIDQKEPKTRQELETVSQVLDRFQGDDKRTVTLIVDFHGHFNSQLNSARMVHELSKNEGINLIGVEGGIGELDAIRFRIIPDEDVRKKLAEVFMKAGYLSGPEYYAAVVGEDLKLVGLEDGVLYTRNLGEFRGVWKAMRSGGEDELVNLQKALDSVVSKMWPKEAIDLVKLMEDYNMSKMGPDEYASQMLAYAERYRVDIPEGSELAKVKKITELGQEIDKEKLKAEMKEVGTFVEKQLSADEKKDLDLYALEYRLKKRSAADYFGWIGKKAKDFGMDIEGKYGNFQRFLERSKLQSSLNADQVDKDAVEVGENVFKEIVQDENARKMLGMTRWMRLVSNMVHLNLNHGEWDELLREGVSLETLVRTLNEAGASVQVTPILDESEKVAHSFYETAGRRDEVLLQKMLQGMEEKGKNKGILFCGGFHSQGISARLKQMGISYELMVPLVEGERKNEEYLENMLDESGLNTKGIWAAMREVSSLQLQRLLFEMKTFRSEDEEIQGRLDNALLTALAILDVQKKLRDGERVSAESLEAMIIELKEKAQKLADDPKVSGTSYSQKMKDAADSLKVEQNDETGGVRVSVLGVDADLSNAGTITDVSESATEQESKSTAEVSKQAEVKRRGEIYGSMEEMANGLPQAIEEKLIQSGLNQEEANHAESLLGMIGDLYRTMGLWDANYHNQIHNLGVTYAMLMMASSSGLAKTSKDVKVSFLAALLHDFHVRDVIDEKGMGTPASVAETMRQLKDLLGIEAYPEAPMGLTVEASDKYNKQRNKYLGSVTEAHKAAFQTAIKGFLGTEELEKLLPEIVVMIRRTDFASDVAPAPPAYKTLGAQVRGKLEQLVKKGLDAGDIAKQIEDAYKQIDQDIDADSKLTADQKETAKKWAQRQRDVELAYLEALGNVSTDRRQQVHQLAFRLEKGSDQSGFYWLVSPEMIERDIVTGLQSELGKDKASPAGSYPFFFVPELLNPIVLELLKDLPFEYRRNFIRVMEYFSKLSSDKGVKMPPYGLDPEPAKDWALRQKDRIDEQGVLVKGVLSQLGLYVGPNGEINEAAKAEAAAAKSPVTETQGVSEEAQKAEKTAAMEAIRRLKLLDKDIESVSCYGKYFVVRYKDTAVTVFDLESGGVKLDIPAGTSGYAWGPNMSEDEKYLIISYMDWKGNVTSTKVLDIENGADLGSLIGQDARDARFSSDGKRLIVTYEKSVRVFDLDGRVDLEIPIGSLASVYNADFSKDGKRLIVKSKGLVTIFDLEREGVKWEYPVDSYETLTFSNDGKRLIVESPLFFSAAKIVDLERGELFRTRIDAESTFDEDGRIISFRAAKTFSRDNKFLIIRSEGSTKVFDLDRGTNLEDLIGKDVVSAEFSFDGKSLIVRNSGFVRVIDLERQVVRFDMPIDPYAFTTFSDDAKHLIVRNPRSSTATAVDMERGSKIELPIGQDVRNLRFKSDGKRLVVWKDGTVVVFDLERGRVKLEIPLGRFDAADVDASGKFLHVYYRSESFKTTARKVFDLELGMDLESLIGQDIRYAEFSGDGQRLVVRNVGSSDRVVYDLFGSVAEQLRATSLATETMKAAEAAARLRQEVLDYVQAGSAEEIRGKTGQYPAMSESYSRVSAAELFASEAGKGLPEDAKRVAEEQLAEVARRTAEHFGADGFRVDAEDKEIAEAALAEHIGYVSGVLRRKFGANESDVREALLEYYKGNGDIAILRSKFTFLDDKFLTENGYMFSGGVDDKKNWQFWGFGKADIALNRPGVYAGEAVLRFADALTGGRGADLLKSFLTRSDEQIEALLRGEGDKNEVALAAFSARAAQVGWLVSKLGQGIVEAHNPKKEANSIKRWAPGSSLITTFDAMAAGKGWQEVAKDIDQIKAFAQHKATIDEARAAAAEAAARLRQEVLDYVQAGSAEEIRGKTGQYPAMSESYSRVSAAELFASEAGKGLPEDAKRVAEEQLAEVARRTAEHFGADGFRVDAEDKEIAEAALAEHIGYVSGVLRRKFGANESDVREALLEYYKGNGDIAILRSKFTFLDDKFLTENGYMFSGGVDDKKNWQFWGFGKADIALNRPGVYAGEAVLRFADALTGGRGADLLKSFLTRSDEQIEALLRGEGDKNEVALAAFSARAAQVGWLVSKLGQGIVEAHNPKKEANSIKRWAPGSSLITTFDAMAAGKGWQEVAKDIDQIKAFAQHKATIDEARAAAARERRLAEIADKLVKWIEETSIRERVFELKEDKDIYQRRHYERLYGEEWRPEYRNRDYELFAKASAREILRKELGKMNLELASDDIKAVLDRISTDMIFMGFTSNPKDSDDAEARYLAKYSLSDVAKRHVTETVTEGVSTAELAVSEVIHGARPAEGFQGIHFEGRTVNFHILDSTKHTETFFDVNGEQKLAMRVEQPGTEIVDIYVTAEAMATLSAEEDMRMALIAHEVFDEGNEEGEGSHQWAWMQVKKTNPAGMMKFLRYQIDHMGLGDVRALIEEYDRVQAEKISAGDWDDFETKLNDYCKLRKAALISSGVKESSRVSSGAFTGREGVSFAKMMGSPFSHEAEFASSPLGLMEADGRRREVALLEERDRQERERRDREQDAWEYDQKVRRRAAEAAREAEKSDLETSVAILRIAERGSDVKPSGESSGDSSRRYFEEEAARFGFMGKLFRKDENGNLHQVREGIKLDPATGKFTANGEELYTKDGNTAVVEVVETQEAEAMRNKIKTNLMKAIDIVIQSMPRSNVSLNALDVARLGLENIPITIIKTNRHINGFSDGGSLYISEELLNDPIALFHELMEGIFARGSALVTENNVRIKEVLPKGLNAHTLLRGAGKDLRKLEGIDKYLSNPTKANLKALQKFLKRKLGDRYNAVEMALIRYNASRGKMGDELLHGLQDEIFGWEANQAFSRKLETLASEARAKAVMHAAETVSAVTADLEDKQASGTQVGGEINIEAAMLKNALSTKEGREDFMRFLAMIEGWNQKAKKDEQKIAIRIVDENGKPISDIASMGLTDALEKSVTALAGINIGQVTPGQKLFIFSGGRDMSKFDRGARVSINASGKRSDVFKMIMAAEAAVASFSVKPDAGDLQSAVNAKLMTLFDDMKWALTGTNADKLKESIKNGELDKFSIDDDALDEVIAHTTKEPFRSV